MFKNIANLARRAEQKKKAQAKPSKVSLKLHRSAMKMNAAAATIRSSSATVNTVCEQLGVIANLRDVIDTYGASKALMALVNHDGQLSQAVASVPSVESMDVIPLQPKSNANRRIVAGLTLALESKDAIVQNWLDSTADNLTEMLTSAKEQVNELAPMIAGTKAALETAAISNEELAGETVIAIPCPARTAMVTAVAEVLEQISVPTYDAEKGDDIANAHTALGALTQSLAAFTGASYDAGQVVTNSDDISGEYAQKEGTLLDLEYTVENVIALCNASEKLVGVLLALFDRQAAIVERIKSVLTTKVTEESNEEVAEQKSEDEDGETTSETPAGEDDGGAVPEDEAGAPEGDVGETPAEPIEGSAADDAEEAGEFVDAIDVHRAVIGGYVAVVLLAVEVGVASLGDAVSVGGVVADMVIDDSEPAGYDD